MRPPSLARNPWGLEGEFIAVLQSATELWSVKKMKRPEVPCKGNGRGGWRWGCLAILFPLPKFHMIDFSPRKVKERVNEQANEYPTGEIYF